MCRTDRNRHTSVSILSIFLASCFGLLAHVPYVSAATGLLTWFTNAYDGTNGFAGANVAVDEATAVATDSAGNIYVTGGSTQTSGCAGGFPDCGLDYATLKYNSNGTALWASPPRYNNGGGDVATAITVDSGGNVYVTGRSSANASDTNYDYATVKYNSSGAQQWVARYDGGSNAEARAIAVDGSGNVYVTGRVGAGGSNDIATVKYNSSGGLVAGWGTAGVITYDSGGNDQGIALVLDSSGNPVITGRITNGGANAFYTVKYSATDGSIVSGWGDADNTYDADSSAIPGVMKIDSSGNVYIAGRKTSQNSGDFLAVKYDSTGVRQWAATYNRGDDIANSLAVDGSGNVYVAGQSTSTGGTSDYVLVKLNGSGAQQWVAVYDNGGAQAPASVGIGTVGAGSGHVYLAGSAATGTGTYDYVTVMYDSSGTAVWASTYDGGNDDSARAMVVDNSGASFGMTSIIVVGGNYNDYSTVKYLVSSTLSASLPDLAVTALTGPAIGTDVASGDLHIVNTVVNQGAGPAGASAVAFYLVDSSLVPVSFTDNMDGTTPPWSALSGGTVGMVTSAEDGWVLRKAAGGVEPAGGTAPLAGTVSDFDLRLYTRSDPIAGANDSRYSLTNSSGNGYDIGLNYNTSTGSLELARRTGWTRASLGTGSMTGVLHFDGVDDYVNVPYNVNLNPAAITIEAWVKWDGLQTGTIVSRGYGNAGYRIQLNAPGRTMSWIGNNSALNSTGTVPPNTWTHVAVTGGAAGRAIYINGVLAGSNATPYVANLADTGSLTLGMENAMPAFANYFKGTLDDMAIYNTAYDASTIATHYSSTLSTHIAVDNANLISDWRFNETTFPTQDTTALDSKSPFEHGTLVNGTERIGVERNYYQWYTLQLRRQGTTLTARAFLGRVNPDVAVPMATVTAADSTYSSFSQVNVTGANEIHTDDLRVAGPNTVNLATQGYLIGTRSIPALFQEHSTADTTLSIPASVPPGLYTLAAQADSGGAVAESDENNNITFGTSVSTFEPKDRYITFDGVNDYVEVPNNASLNPAAVTVEAWVRWDGTQTGSIVSKGFGNNGYRIQLNNELSGKVSWITNGSLIVLLTPNPIPLNTWTHVAVTAGAAGHAIYIDGVLEASVSTPYGAPVTPETLTIGTEDASPVFTSYYKGDLDDVRLWNIVRTQAEIQAAKDLELVGNEAGLVAYWNFNEVSGTLAPDSTANNNNGTLINGPAWATGVLFGLSNSNESGGGGAIEPVELVVLAAFGFGLLIIVRRHRNHGLQTAMAVSFVLAGMAANSHPVQAANLTFNFSGNTGMWEGCDANCGPEPGGNAEPQVNENVIIDGVPYHHYVNLDPANGFAQEVYVAGGYNGIGLGAWDPECCASNMGNEPDPLGTEGSPWTFTGNGTFNPRRIAMRTLITEVSDDPESPYAYSFYSDFLKDDPSRKPRIVQQINPSSDENHDVIVNFVADMRGVAYGDKATDISTNPLHYINTLILLDPAVKGYGDFNVSTGAQEPSVTAGRYTLDTLNNPNGYSYWNGTYSTQAGGEEWATIFCQGPTNHGDGLCP